jgi:hypothetical protein
MHFIMQNFFLVHVGQTPLDSNKPYSLSFSHQLLRLCPKRNSLKVTNQLPTHSRLAIPALVFIGKEKSETCERVPKNGKMMMTLPVSCDPECFAAPVRLFTSLQTGSLQCMNVSENPPNFFLLMTISSMKNQEKDMIVSFNDWVSQGLHTCPRQLINAWYLSFC